MARALSVDLRERVVAAVSSGMSCRAAAVRFGVSAASAIRWRQRAIREGAPAPRQQGGDRRSRRIDGHGELIRKAIAVTPDVTLAELQAMLRDHGVSAGISFGRCCTSTACRSASAPCGVAGTRAATANPNSARQSRVRCRCPRNSRSAACGK